MRSIAPAAGILLAATLLATAAPATASPPGASVVLDQPDGFTDPFTGAGGYSDVGSNRAVSADGRFVAFLSTADGLSGADDNRVQNVFRKDRPRKPLAARRNPPATQVEARCGPGATCSSHARAAHHHQAGAVRGEPLHEHAAVRAPELGGDVLRTHAQYECRGNCVRDPLDERERNGDFAARVEVIGQLAGSFACAH